jgi:hypothetical protein
LFTSLYGFDESDVCLVLASNHYEPEKSQRSWDEFTEMKKRVENAGKFGNRRRLS